MDGWKTALPSFLCLFGRWFYVLLRWCVLFWGISCSLCDCIASNSWLSLKLSSMAIYALWASTFFCTCKDLSSPHHLLLSTVLLCWPPFHHYFEPFINCCFSFFSVSLHMQSVTIVLSLPIQTTGFSLSFLLNFHYCSDSIVLLCCGWNCAT